MGDGSGRPSSADPPSDVSLDAIPLHSTNLLTLLDESGVVRYESPSIERIFGYEQDELIGERVADYFHPEDRERVVAAFGRVVASDEYTVEAVEYRHERADGSYCWVESVASADPTPEGHYVVNTRGVTERKARERELVATNERLDEFAQVLSHDLRNPLAVARGHLDLATETCGSEHLAEIDRAHDRMERLIDDLLTLARDGETERGRERVDLAAVATDCWRTVETGDATLVTATERAIRADRTRVRQLFENLLRNAVEHGSTSPPSQAREDAVEHGSSNPAPETGGLTVAVGDLRDGFYVEDDGIGMPAGERSRMFELGRSGEDGGTGIGLSIVARVSSDHGWEVDVTESVNGGLRFEFTGVEFDDTP